jgi:pyruvate dehydrogenase E2 component (dihydrolipoamide acetyltransferase)
MVASAFTAPHVTEFVTVDVTRTMRLAERLRSRPDLAGAKVSPLLLVARALLLAVRRNPGVNASFDAAAGEIVTEALRQPGHRSGNPARARRPRTSRTPTPCRCPSLRRR